MEVEAELREIQNDSEVAVDQDSRILASACDLPTSATSTVTVKIKKEGGSSVWKFFQITNSKRTNAKCKLCSKVDSTCSGKGRGASTSSLLNHLKFLHKPEHADLLKIENQKKIKLRLSQPTLDSIAEKKKKWDINDHRATKINYLIGEMIAVDNQPFSIVEDVGFKRMISHIAPQYQIPSRYYFTTKLIPNIYDRCQTILLCAMENVSFICITTDIWSCSINNESFISLTAHWINDDIEVKQASLNSKNFPGSHTAENIADILTNMLINWKISGKVHTVVRDNGANISKGIIDAGLHGSACFIHTLQLVIEDSIKSQRSVNDMIAVSRRIVSHFNHSSLACNKLKIIQESMKMTPKKLIQDICTRWNSTFYMLERLLEQRNAVTLYTAENGITNLSLNQWQLLEATLSLLQPFEEITKMISSSESIISEVIPLVKTLTAYLCEENPDHFGVGTMKKEMKINITTKTTRFKDIEENIHYAAATFLDPRYKTKFLSKESSIRTKNVLLEEAIKLIFANTSLTPETTVSQASSVIQKAHSTLWVCFDRISKPTSTAMPHCSTIPMSSPPVTSSAEQVVEREIEVYLGLSLLDRKDNPINWWKANKSLFPHLTKLVRKYLSAPASSVYSERLFSEIGIIYEDTRNRMLPRNGEMLAFLHHNLKHLNYKY